MSPIVWPLTAIAAVLAPIAWEAVFRRLTRRQERP